MKRPWLFFIAVFAVLFIWRGWQTSYSVKKFTKYGEFFGSTVKVDVCYREDRRAALESSLDDVWKRFADIHSRLSVYDSDSDINKINRSYNASVTVPQDTYRLIQNSLEYHEISRGVYDITVGPLIALWKEKGKRGIMPTEDEIKNARLMVDIKAVNVMANHQIELTRPDVKINIDSVGDGFAADEAAKILRAGGFTDFLVDASGELYAGGHNCKGEKWRVGIRDPHDTENIIDIVEISDQAVSTSGSYERFYEIQGKRWSHIIDPHSGYPAQGIISATVVAPSAEFADFLSTAFCILPARESVGIIDAMGQDYAAMMVVEDGDNEKKEVGREYHKYSIKK